MDVLVLYLLNNIDFSLETVTVRLGSILSHPIPDPAAVYTEADRVYVHPNFTDSPYIDYDVALLHLSTPIVFSDMIQPICLPQQNEDIDKLEVCVSTGFGRIRDEGRYRYPIF